MNKLFVEKMKKTLLEEKASIISKANQELNVDTEGDETDEIQANMLIELNAQLETRDVSRLTEINNALQKISESTYGLCEDCGDAISEKRLTFNPYFLTCISCAEEREFEAKQKKRS